MSAERPLIGNGWRTYAEHVLPSGAPKVQTQETRRAFYAGAQHLLSIYWEIAGDDVSEDEGVRRLESVRAELQRFVNDVQSGRM